MHGEIHIPILGEELSFPDPLHARLDGLVAFGGDLSAERLLLAYECGIFPWSANPITWWSPDPRSIIPLDQFHVPRRLRQIMRHPPYEIVWNRHFDGVIHGCAKTRPDRPRTWITPEFIRAYRDLHRFGRAHSVECWKENRLVGGVYGVAVGGLFAGESMFHEEDHASNIALVTLLEACRAAGFVLFDTQIATPHTRRFGAIDISRRHYLQLLKGALKVRPQPLPPRTAPSVPPQKENAP